MVIVDMMYVGRSRLHKYVFWRLLRCVVFVVVVMVMLKVMVLLINGDGGDVHGDGCDEGRHGERGDSAADDGDFYA